MRYNDVDYTMWRRFFWILLDELVPLSSEAAIARALSEDILANLVHPVTLVKDPWITALFPYYNPKVRALIRAMKYRGEKAPLPALGRIVADELLPILEEKRTMAGWNDIHIVHMPSSPERLRKRGYNQAERITLAILPYVDSDIEYAPDVLAREDRPSQVNVAKDRRHKNMTGAFFVLRPEKVRGIHIVLIDDVVETGATFKDARRALLEAGAADVIAIAIAH
jgi:ComF family protein